MNLSASIFIDRSPDQVFDFVSDVANMARWVTGVAGARLESGEMTTGARFTVDYRQGWRTDSVDLEVVEMERPIRWATRAVQAPFQFAGAVDLEPMDGGTRVTNTIEATADSLSTKLVSVLLGPLLLRSMRKRLRRELDALSRAITTP